MRNETLRLMRRGAAHRLKFVERCGGGCRRGAGEFGAGEQVSRYGWAKGQRSTNNWRGVVLQYWSVLSAALGESGAWGKVVHLCGRRGRGGYAAGGCAIFNIRGRLPYSSTNGRSDYTVGKSVPGNFLWLSRRLSVRNVMSGLNSPCELFNAS